jgi:DNA processing protein
MNDPARLERLLTINCVKGIGVVLFGRLVRHFGSVEAVLSAGEKRLREVRGIGPVFAKGLMDAVKRGDGAREIELAEKHGIKIIAHDDPEYPQNLRSVFDHPLLLYVKGDLRDTDLLAVAVVGSRHCTIYGQQQGERLGHGLAQRGICVVSGLARGVDTHAHTGALKANGRTVAVLGSGLLNVYPAENRKLAEKISESGAVASELPLKSPPEGTNFPRRNRVVSGMSLGVVVVEAAEKSGSLITADWALEQGREVFAVPGRVDGTLSRGCHNLIKLGAKLVESVDDILEELGPYQQLLAAVPAGADLKKPARPRLDRKEEIIFGLLSAEPKQIDEIIDESQLPPSAVASALLVMEMRGLTKQLPGKNFVLAGVI